MRLLVTGGAGFIGSALVRRILRGLPEAEITNLDLLTYAGNRDNLERVEEDPRHVFVQGDICDGSLVRKLAKGAQAVLNLAAETHVDRSIRAPAPFLATNILGTHTLLDAARDEGVERFLQVSTDEVYGELPWIDPARADGSGARFTEESPIRPRSPYAASKAAADHLVLSYGCTYGMDVLVVRGSNNYGPRQHPEKLIPRMISRALTEKALPLYGDGLNVRDWMFVEDFCAGILTALKGGRAGEVYNFGGGSERTNLQVAGAVLDLLGASRELIRLVEDRPGHDRRYAVDFSKARRELGWVPRAEFDAALAETVAWYRARPRWIREREREAARRGAG